jgi:phosphoribosyl 1,2-cyclic phosphodiesterase
VAAELTILGSGSGGNCAYLETPQVKLLVDAGFSGKQVAARLAAIGRSPEQIDAILLTHEHSDHTQGLPILCKRHNIPVYANRLTVEALQEEMPAIGAAGLWKIFQTGQTFALGDVTVETFTVPHDAHDPVGFLLRHNGTNIGFLTDLGQTTRLVIERVRPAHVLLLETNHDMRLLMDDKLRPPSVKQRILSRHGHLSNDAAAEAATQLATGNLRHLYLGHLSRDCNRPELACAAIGAALQAAGAPHVKVEVTSQETPNATLRLS